MRDSKLRRPLKILSKGEIHDIHSASLEVLQDVGVRFQEENALNILEAGGAEVDHRKQLAKFPAYLVEEAIRKCPRRIRIYGRTNEHDLTLGDGIVHFSAGAVAININDLDTGERRRPTSKDCEQLTRICDALEHAEIIQPVVVPQDIPHEIADRVRCKIFYENSEKHYACDVYGKDSARDLIRMAAAVAGGLDELRKRPLITISPGVNSPLTWGTQSTQAILECARHRIPQFADGMPNAGATAPITLAGTLVEQNVENLSFVTLAQLVNPGTPAYACGEPAVTNMRTGGAILGAVEVAIVSAAMSQIYSWYGIPYSTSVGLTDSKVPDEQAAYEKSISFLMAALAGPSLVFTLSGSLNSIIDTSYEQTLIDDEIVGMISRAISGMNVNKDTMAVDLIARVGPGGHFLGQKHTKDFLLGEHYLPELADRNSRNKWEKDGEKSIVMRARDRAREILRTHNPAPLEEHVRKQMDEIVNEAKKNYSSASRNRIG